MTTRPRPRRNHAPVQRALRIATLVAAGVLLAGTGRSRAADTTGTASARRAPDVSAYQALLSDYVEIVSRPGAPLETRFDYERLYDAPDRTGRFAAIREQMFAVPPSAMESRARLAWAINAYNYLVLETATTNLIVPGKGRVRYSDPRLIKVNRASFFRAPVIQLGDRWYSLDEFEQEFARLGGRPLPSGRMPDGFDARVHFALVCGAQGCPPLLPRAYRAESLEVQLDFATRNALAQPRHLRYENGSLKVSELFRWYMTEFGGRQGVLDFVTRHAPRETRRALERDPPRVLGGYIPWDWKLNQYPRNLVR